ncbi:unnamed protein product [Phytomonas sp. EM1]|nr:unnamed protein product [Phytomonas sp. EM1]|eukprot:CCW64066.1 unnamed protein product [Phytomonas sp. isolate EM1]
MTSSSFEFVQGNERLDWGVLVAIDLQRLTKDTNVDTLQRIVENLAFSHISRDEAAMFSPDHILHLFKLMQVVIQYLVFSQECLAKLNGRLNDHVGELRGAVDLLEQSKARLLDEREVLKKEVKAQRRTLLAYEYTAAATSRGRDHLDARRTSATPPGAAPAKSFVCPTCGAAYHKAESLQSHVRKRHGAGFPRDGAAAPAAGAMPSSADASRHEAELRQMQDRLEHLERQLEKERDAASQQQRDQMMQLLIQQISNLKDSTNERAKDSQSQPLPPPPPQPLSALPGAASPTPAAMEITGLSPSRALPVTHGNILPRSADSISSIPVVPDLAAMTEYNLSRQRQTEHATLVRQMHDLEKELRDLKQVAREEVGVKSKPASILMTSSLPFEGHKAAPEKPPQTILQTPASIVPLKPPAVQPDIVGTISMTPPPEAPKKSPALLPISTPPPTKSAVQVPYSTIPVQPSAASAVPAQPSIPTLSTITTSNQDTPSIPGWVQDSKQQTATVETGNKAPWRPKEYSISLSSSTSTASTVQPNEPPDGSSGLDATRVLGPTSPTNYSFLNSLSSIKPAAAMPDSKALSPTPALVPFTPTPSTATSAPIPTPTVVPTATAATPTMPGQPAYATALVPTTGGIAATFQSPTPNSNHTTLRLLRRSPDSSDSDDSSS